jgi:hypothetical protein
MSYSYLDGLLDDTDELFGREMFRTRCPSSVGCWSAIKTALVALVGDGDTQVINFSAE